MLFYCEDKNSENELRRQEHLDDWSDLVYSEGSY